MTRRFSRFPGVVTWGMLLFFYVPLLVVTVYSFNAGKYGGAWVGFSWKWYRKLLTDPVIWEACINTAVIALVSSFFATLLGTLAALALHRGKMRRALKLQQSLIYSSLVVPDILMGISLLLLFVSFQEALGPFLERWTGLRLQLGMTTVIIAHITFCTSYVALVVQSRLQDFDTSLTEAAQDLGANALQTFRYVTFPAIAPTVFAGGLFAFTLSVDDFVITFFVKGAGGTTLPVYIQSTMRRGTPAVINAMSVCFLVLTFVMVFVCRQLLRKKE